MCLHLFFPIFWLWGASIFYFSELLAKVNLFSISQISVPLMEIGKIKNGLYLCIFTIFIIHQNLLHTHLFFVSVIYTNLQILGITKKRLNSVQRCNWKKDILLSLHQDIFEILNLWMNWILCLLFMHVKWHVWVSIIYVYPQQNLWHFTPSGQDLL